MRFEDIVEKYESVFAGQKSSSTLFREAQYLKGKMVPSFRGMLLEDIRREDVERYLMKRVAEGIRPATRNRLLSVLSALFKKSIRMNWLRENPCAGIPRIKEERREPPFLDFDAQRRLVAAMPLELRDAVALSLDTGLRRGELLRLDWNTDVDLTRQVLTVRVSKSKTPRIVPFTSRGRLALENCSARRKGGHCIPDLVFGDLGVKLSSGELVMASSPRQAWEKARVLAGFPDLHWHDLRHVYATTAARAGVPLGDLQKILGHSTMAMVLRYASHSPANSGDLARTRLEEYLGSGGTVQEPLPEPYEALAGA